MYDIVIDFETRSRVDLPIAGTDNYAADPSTDILCLAVHQLTTNAKWLWVPGQPTHRSFHQAIIDAPRIWAFNARFDQLIWEYIGVDYGLPRLKPSQWWCVAAQCRVNALPGSLDHAARAINAGHRKDHKGTALIKKLSIPDADGNFNNDPQLLLEMYAYCEQDVAVTVELLEATRTLSKMEHVDWLCNERVNDRGVMVDTYLAELVIPYAHTEQEHIATQLPALTGGKITKHTQSIRLRDYLVEHFHDNPTALNLMRVEVDGTQKMSASKPVRAMLMELDITPRVKTVIELFNDGNRSSVAKFQRMLDLADSEDERVRGCFLYAGAGQTKRTSSRGLQLQNMIKDCFTPEETEAIITRMIAVEPLPNVMTTLSKLLRPALVPAEGHVFVVGDWSAIEARVLPWLTAAAGGEEVLDVFRRGEDVYVHTATSMHMTDRLIGKVATLALGFAGGVGALMAMAKMYGLHFTDAEAQRIVDAWRAGNKWAVRFWAKTERAAANAVTAPGNVQRAGRLTYHFDPHLLDGTLVCTLPSGETIQYPSTRFELVSTKFGTRKSLTYAKASLTPRADATEWPRASLYSAILVENATQAVAGEILRNTMRKTENVVMTVHDELVLEVPAAETEHALHTLQECMETPPEWASGLPLAAEPQVMTRYGK